MKSMGLRSGVFMVCVGGLVLACGGEADDTGEPIGTATIEISTVPAGAQCLQVIGTGAAAFNVTAPLTPGVSSATVSLGRLPLGAATVSASVFDAACASLAGATATWLAETQSVTFRAGVATKLTLNLRPNNAVTVNANFIGNIVSMTAGYQTTGLVLGDGTTRTAGNWNPAGGGSIFTDNNPALTGIVELEAAKIYNAHACARNANQVVCWGSNPNGQLGPGIVVGTFSSTPVVVTGLPGNVQQLAVANAHTCALATGGGIYCWGANANGELGNNSTTSSATPQFVSITAATDMIAAGSSFTCANTYAGVRCWGLNSSGQLGDGTTTTKLTPTTNGLEGTVSLAAGSTHACAVRADGTARCWGSNGAGQLGDGTTTQRLVPTQVSGLSDAVEVAAGASFTCFRRTGGSVSCVGENGFGQLGDGTATDRLTLGTVPGVSGAIALAAGFGHACAFLENRSVTCWGWDFSGQCGDGTVGDNFKPVAAVIQ
jgi:alpha-tubulin suppressor-like RCC1 family protein